MLIYMAMIETPEEKDRFEAIYLKYRYLMLHVAGKILENHHDAEDAVHEAFVAIIRNIEKFYDIESPKTRSLIVLIVGNLFEHLDIAVPTVCLRLNKS